jgi:hypothetical protein
VHGAQATTNTSLTESGKEASHTSISGSRWCGRCGGTHKRDFPPSGRDQCWTTVDGSIFLRFRLVPGSILPATWGRRAAARECVDRPAPGDDEVTWQQRGVASPAPATAPGAVAVGVVSLRRMLSLVCVDHSPMATPSCEGGGWLLLVEFEQGADSFLFDGW